MPWMASPGRAWLPASPPLVPVLPNPPTVKEENVVVLTGRGNFFLGRLGPWVGRPLSLIIKGQMSAKSQTVPGAGDLATDTKSRLIPKEQTDFGSSLALPFLRFLPH